LVDDVPVDLTTLPPLKASVSWIPNSVQLPRGIFGSGEATSDERTRCGL